MVRLLSLLLLPTLALAQYNSQTYPDPRLDPLQCGLAFPGTVCDPTRILSDDERGKIAQRIQQLTSVTAPIRNTSPSCALRPSANLEIFVAVIDKIGSVPHAADVGVCDTSVLIVNSRQDRQVFTVAGRDAKISKATLRKAFERNVGHFKDGRYALGLEGMIEVIVASYGNAHIVQTPTGENFGGFDQTHNTITQRAAGAPSVLTTDAKQIVSEREIVEIEEADKVWVQIMQLALARCGSDRSQFTGSVRAVVEEAMQISLALISDSRYNSIEEEVDKHKDILGIREQAWNSAASSFLLPLYEKYNGNLASSPVKSCPNPNVLQKLLRRRL
ncbi:hypothetical protein PRIPAC_87463 [Pristionchus pacificus]|uniref:Uncharacterized protein n=1 Tax=Pristionchus pacificus TaxID=54126 RepID=A0A2A6B7K3_PRIPA|nr:hypothetical protein PRIPAC_87463 [Pristionchus pacificus]|eukprot:PDM61844.1 hypothetical protein PRIPAC_51286 [Pristionchus pacificus]